LALEGELLDVFIKRKIPLERVPLELRRVRRERR